MIFKPRLQTEVEQLREKCKRLEEKKQFDDAVDKKVEELLPDIIRLVKEELRKQEKNDE